MATPIYAGIGARATPGPVLADMTGACHLGFVDPTVLSLTKRRYVPIVVGAPPPTPAATRMEAIATP